jgi:lactam utilization protein B
MGDQCGWEWIVRKRLVNNIMKKSDVEKAYAKRVARERDILAFLAENHSVAWRALCTHFDSKNTISVTTVLQNLEERKDIEVAKHAVKTVTITQSGSKRLEGKG